MPTAITVVSWFRDQLSHHKEGPLVEEKQTLSQPTGQWCHPNFRVYEPSCGWFSEVTQILLGLGALRARNQGSHS